MRAKEFIIESMTFYPAKKVKDKDYPNGYFTWVFPNEWTDEYDTKHPDYKKRLYGDEEGELPRNPKYKPHLDLNLSNSNMRDVFAELGWEIEDSAIDVPIDMFIGKATQWLKQHINKPSGGLDSSVEKGETGPTIIHGGRRDNYFNDIILRMIRIAREGKQHGAEYVVAV